TGGPGPGGLGGGWEGPPTGARAKTRSAGARRAMARGGPRAGRRSAGETLPRPPRTSRHEPPRTRDNSVPRGAGGSSGRRGPGMGEGNEARGAYWWGGG